MDDERPGEQEPLEFWDGPVQPERIRRDDQGFARLSLHNAANLAHVSKQADVPEGDWRLYKVACVGGCVLYDRAKLLDCGGFGFWKDLPAEHAGEDVTAQWRVMSGMAEPASCPRGRCTWNLRRRFPTAPRTLQTSFSDSCRRRSRLTRRATNGTAATFRLP